MKVVFRVDASLQIGTGHVMRCLTLAEALKQQGAEVEFICREHKGNLIERIERQGFKVHKLPQYAEIIKAEKELKDSSNVEREVLYGKQWLGSTQQQDAEQCKSILEKIKPDWLIVDHYAIDHNWQAQLQGFYKKLMVIDDLADRKHLCDLLLDQNFYLNPEDRYSELCTDNCKMFLGPNYALLRDEFVQMKIEDNSRLNEFRIFVFLGGTDQSNETSKVINALSCLIQRGLNIFADVVVGPTNPNFKSLEKLCDQRKNISFFTDVTNMAELMSYATIAIGAGGASTIERCYVGLPSLVILVAENQIETTNDLAAVGAIKNLGWFEDVSEEKIVKAMEDIIKTPKVLASMKEQALFISGKNTRDFSEVVKEMCEGNLNYDRV